MRERLRVNIYTSAHLRHENNFWYNFDKIRKPKKSYLVRISPVHNLLAELGAGLPNTVSIVTAT